MYNEHDSLTSRHKITLNNLTCRKKQLISLGGALSIIVIIVGNGINDLSSNPGQDRFMFYFVLMILGKA